MNDPRAANFVRKLDSGPHAVQFLYWFHNHNGRSYEDRNPARLLYRLWDASGQHFSGGRSAPVARATPRSVALQNPPEF